MIPFPASGRPVLWWHMPRIPLRRALLAVIVSAAALIGFPSAAPVNASGHDWQRPVDGEVVEHFSAPPAPWAAGHRGVDLASSISADIRSPTDGVVSFSGTVVDREVLSIDHGAGYISSFEAVDADLEVGDAVAAGEVVAELGTYDDGDNHCDQPCLHWGVRLHGEYINPLLLLGEVEPSVLLPLEAGG